MSLHDVSKHDNERLDPKANASDTRAQRDAHGTNSVNYVSDATTTGGTNTVGTGTPARAGFKQLVGVVVLPLVNNGSTLTTVSAPHGLTFVPKIEADLENATITTAGADAVGSTAPLPTFTAATVAGGNVNFQTYLYAFANATTVYVNLLNATGAPVSLNITCYLYRSSGI